MVFLIFPSSLFLELHYSNAQLQKSAPQFFFFFWLTDFLLFPLHSGRFPLPLCLLFESTQLFSGSNFCIRHFPQKSANRAS